ncbi:MAG TPA: di-heme oxidoredictase family protein [Bacteroidia bacterium]|nr:di-heme oxidoredictase family protein [Bacteroidia bacterium]
MARVYTAVLMLIVLQACAAIEPPAPSDDSLLDGPINGLSAEENRQFLAGDVAFNDEVFTRSTGLGPIFVASSCGTCHAGDGKGHPFSALTRFGQTDSTGNQFLDQGGPQLQHLALPGYQPEQLPAGATSSLFIPPANTGLGYLEAVSDADILAMADPMDMDGDGISGVPNYISLPSFVTPSANAIPRGGKYIGRFGRKAAAYNLLNQTVNAYYQDMGIASDYIPSDILTNQGCDPEVRTQAIADVVFYLRTLKAPIQRNPGDAVVGTGKQLFIQIGCEACHKADLQTDVSNVAALSQVIFHPYTDLLMHDMGPGLDDGYTEGTALTSEWRTTPLWGLGLSADSQGGSLYLMHDGRARSIREAIELHGGEAAGSKDRFMQLTETEKDAVITFLNSL